MKHTYFDIIILGAGINGCAIANTFSQDGKKVLVIDKSTIASGTSSKSSRLIHGGLRYLENFEFSLVKESLKDRNNLVEKYPNLVKMNKFYLPVYKNNKRSSFIIRVGLKLYDLLSWNKNYTSGIINRKNSDEKFKYLRKDNLKSILYYHDAVTDDKKLTKVISEEAKSAGAVFLENYAINTIDKSKEIINIDNAYTTKLLVNATGPWINEVIDKYNLNSDYKINKVSGIHIEIDKLLVSSPMILEAENNRIFFVIPNVKNTIIGTTERAEDCKCDNVDINDEDVKYLLNYINKYFNININRSNIINKWIGIRPLIESKNNLSKISRDYIIDIHNYNTLKVVNIFGGKLTTFNSLSKKVKQKIKEVA